MESYASSLRQEQLQLEQISNQKATEIILRYADILKERIKIDDLDMPMDKISALINQRLPFSARHIQMVLPAEMKRSRTDNCEVVRNVLPRTNLVYYLEANIEIADKLKGLSTSLLTKIMGDKDKLALLSNVLDNDMMQSMVNSVCAIRDDLNSISEMMDDRVIITELEKATIKLQSETESYRKLGKEYHISAKHVSNIVKNKA